MPTRRARVFLVDDHPLVREWLANLLRAQPDFEVIGQAEDAAGGLDAMQVDPPDVAIVDLALKSSSGLDLIKALAVELPTVSTIVLSMHEELSYADRALRAGARGYVTKRESTDRIVDAIRTVLSGRVYATPELLVRLAERIAGGSPRREVGIEALSERERDVFVRLGQGLTTRQAAEEMRVSIKTVQAYCARIKDKLALANGAELVREAVRWSEHQRPA